MHDARLKCLCGLLASGGTLALAENLPSRGQRLSQLVQCALPPAIAEAEEKIYHNAADPIVNWDVAELEEEFKAVGLRDITAQVLPHKRNIILSGALLSRWFNPEDAKSYARRLLDAGLSQEELQLLWQGLAPLVGNSVTFSSSCIVVSGTAQH